MPFESKDWRAWLDRMPGKEFTLHVEATIVVPTTGYAVDLREHGAQGTNPRDLVLELLVEAPSGGATDVETELPATFSKPNASAYTTVSVVPDGPTSIRIKPVD
jgi:hypothetical protein